MSTDTDTNTKAKDVSKTGSLKKHPECIICAEKYNKSTRLPVKCEYCPFEACRACLLTYMGNETRFTCMDRACGREWTRKHLVDAFPQTVVKTAIKKIYENQLYEREIGLMPSTQPFVELYHERDRLYNNIHEMRNKIMALESQIYMTRRNIQEIENNIETGNISESKKRTEYVRNCPDNDCRGYLNRSWVCGVCNKNVCNKCHEIIVGTKEEHACIPENVETAETIMRETVPCPKCSTRIFKISGCNQMFCTQCKTPFDWRTGRVINGEIHNPHYFEWLRSRQGENAPAPAAAARRECGQHVSASDFSTAVYMFESQKRNISNPKEHQMIETYRNILHLAHEIEPRYNIDVYSLNRNIRINYMMSRIDETEFRETILRTNREAEKKQEWRQVFNMISTSCRDVIDRLYDNLVDLRDKTNMPASVRQRHAKPNGPPIYNVEEATPIFYQYIDSAICEIAEIARYANVHLDQIHHTYNCVKYQFSDRIELHSMTK